jgi:hypothetical protein
MRTQQKTAEKQAELYYMKSGPAPEPAKPANTALMFGAGAVALLGVVYLATK